MMFVRFAAEQLFRIGLSLNSSKVEVFSSRQEYDDYWCFDMFQELVNDPESAARRYFALLDSGQMPVRSRHSSLLNALAWRPHKLTPDTRRNLIGRTLNRAFLDTADINMLHRVSPYYTRTDRREFLALAEEIFKDLRFNATPLKLYQFFQTNDHFSIPEFAISYIADRHYQFRWTVVWPT